MRKERVGFAVCGSFCTHEKVLKALEALTEIYETVITIVSEISAFTDTRFGRSEDLLERLEDLTGNDVLLDIPSVEPIGPKGLLDVLVIAPATGNTIAKLAAGIADTSVTMAAKYHLRNGRPVVLAVSSNDGLAAGAKNIGELLVGGIIILYPLDRTTRSRSPVPWWRIFRSCRRPWTPLCGGNRFSPCCCGEEKGRGKRLSPSSFQREVTGTSRRIRSSS